MTANKQDRERAVKQVLASWALEGLQPDAEFLSLLERYVNGELTLEQVDALADAAFGAAHTEVPTISAEEASNRG